MTSKHISLANLTRKAYRNEIIPAPKKGVTVNETVVEKKKDKNIKGEKVEKAQDTKGFKEDYAKMRICAEDDNALNKEVTEIAKKLAEDPKNADIKVYKHADIQAFLKTKNKRVCWDCKSYNCMLKQTLSSKHHLNKRFLNNCKGKQLSFKELAENLKVSNTETEAASAQITTPTPANYDPEEEEIAAIIASIEADNAAKENEFGYQNYSVEFSHDVPITEDMIPVYAEYKKTATVPDKQCIICLKKNMNLKKLTAHYLTHDMFFAGDEDDSNVDEWLEARYESYTIPRDSDSDEQTDKEEEDDEQEPQSTHPQSTPSDSSSENSSDNESQPQRR